MNESKIERADLPENEKKLSDMLDFACEQLYPTTGFGLELQGIKPALLTQKELEAYSGASLDNNSGATIKLVYDVASEQLIFESLRHPIANHHTAAFVIHKTQNETDGLQYIAFLDLAGEKYRPVSDGKNTPLFDETVNQILSGYQIGDIPHPSHDEYRLWRANLLSNCQDGWKLSEKVEILVGMEEHNTEVLQISVNEEFQQKGIVSRVKEISHVYIEDCDVSNDPDSAANSGNSAQNHTKKFESKLTQIDEDYSRVLSLRKISTEKEYDPFVVGDEGKVLSKETKVLPMNQRNFNIFKSLLDNAALFLQSPDETR